ncbi:cell division cycle 20.2, cofactor of APC complex-like [Hibiscus syriacus]|uniref:cell division cycle 20.2, cofactor of APC complex-like n=1 Tax=Hibiscus syriacus TaxID=106335 RepID=UPI00192274CF|nr:cell division cycle 20.2, cofactor of APC complex-like [Hibiscus syriacus]
MDDEIARWRLLQSDWYSPRRLHDSPIQYDFPGDRFIPNRSLMDLDRAHGLLTNRTTQFNTGSSFNEAYRQKLIENLSLDSQGRPFKIMVFRGSPKWSRKPIRFVDELRQEVATIFDKDCKRTPYRCIPKGEKRVLDAPRLRNDYYANIMSWGNNNILAVALGPELYLWNSEDQRVHKLFQVRGGNDWPTSVTWSEDARILAVGYMCSSLQLWDAESSKLIRNLDGHSGRIASTAWNGRILTSGSRDKSIINHDVRAPNNMASCIKQHADEVCGLKWSTEGNRLASGGNENLLYIWEGSKMSSSKFLHRLSDHCAAVKALAWCPYQYNVLASGGGLSDGCIKIWNTQKGVCISSIETKAQICGLEWNRHHKEILSGHGYSIRETQNKLCLWKYPSMTKVGELGNHKSRIINLCQSPDGITVISAGADETLRFWDVFGPPTAGNLMVSDLQGLLSFKTSPLR